MNTFRQIPLHMLLLAGLLGAAEAKDKEPAGSAAKPAVTGVAYAGLNVGPRDEAVASVPAGVGIVVGFIDPKGPSVGKIEEGDILTRLDDQVLFNADQFRALVRTRQPGDKVRLTLQRGPEPMVVELTLAARTDREPRVEAKDRARAAARGLPPGVTIVGPGGVIPPELLKQLQDLQAGVLPAPGGRSSIPSIDDLRARAGWRARAGAADGDVLVGNQQCAHAAAEVFDAALHELGEIIGRFRTGRFFVRRPEQ
jgi:hypothetical protein